MDLKLTGKHALVTGSTSGIGEAIAKALAAEGASVVIQGRNEERARRVAAEIGDGRAAVALGDLASDEEAERVAEQARRAFGEIDILVNNAGAFPEHDWWRTRPEGWAELYNQDVLSMVRMIQAFVPGMKARGWGRVIQIASTAGVRPRAGSPDYAATKAAIINMTVSLAAELANSGVTANTVSPGPIRTPGLEEAFTARARDRGSSEDWDQIEKEMVRTMIPVPLGRFGYPEEVAAAVAFLASPRASYIHGADLRVDGGSPGTVN
jgi:NAD(P)-dependent dehydrogenase (short-subunit alcohol dehydrogenase family)